MWLRPTPDPFLPRLDGYEVSRVPAVRAVKPYTCPSCHNAIPEGVGHVVVWPDDHVDDRRHWHLHCWHVAVKRGKLA